MDVAGSNLRRLAHLFSPTPHPPLDPWNWIHGMLSKFCQSPAHRCRWSTNHVHSAITASPTSMPRRFELTRMPTAKRPATVPSHAFADGGTYGFGSDLVSAPSASAFSYPEVPSSVHSRASTLVDRSEYGGCHTQDPRQCLKRSHNAGRTTPNTTLLVNRLHGPLLHRRQVCPSPPYSSYLSPFPSSSLHFVSNRCTPFSASHLQWPKETSSDAGIGHYGLSSHFPCLDVTFRLFCIHTLHSTLV